MIYSHFYRHNSFCTVFWVSSFYLSVSIVSYQFTVTCIENWGVRSLGQWIIESKVYLFSMLGREKRFKIAIMFLGRRRRSREESPECICESRCRQVSVRLDVFAGVFGPWTLLRLQLMLGLHFTPVCVLLLVCSLHFTHSLHFTPGPQSAVSLTDRSWNIELSSWIKTLELYRTL